MKYAPFITGLLLGTALGGVVVAATGSEATGGINRDQVKEIVRETIREEPQLILDSVRQHQEAEQGQKRAAANEVLKDPEVKKQIFSNAHDAFAGPKDAKHVVVEFFDYNCPACKMQFEMLDKLMAEHKDVKVIFKEYPIFGEVSEANSKIGLAVWALYPEKYLEFHRSMMQGKGRDLEQTYAILERLGMDVAKVKAEAGKEKYANIIEEEHKLGAKLGIQGTPTLVIGAEITPHALDLDGLKKALKL
jgi:protein-disulfide isomerase